MHQFNRNNAPASFIMLYKYILLALCLPQVYSARDIRSAESSGAQTNNDIYATDSVVIRFNPTAGAATLSAMSAKGLQVTAPKFFAKSLASASYDKSQPHILQQSNLYKITDGSSVEEKIAELSAHPDIAYVEPNYKVKILKTPQDSRYSSQWHLPKIAAPVAWDTVTGSKKVKVCIIDSGARIDHPDLAGNIIKGWNVLEDETSPGYYNYNDTLGHGTHVAGLVAALGNNARGVSGVSWQIGLLICKFMTDRGEGQFWQAVVCMRLCREEGAVIYNGSWGGVEAAYVPSFLRDEIEALGEENGLFVAAAGNSYSNIDEVPKYPASYNLPNQITVAATTSSDAKAAFSDFGPESVHIAAPGQQILSTTADGDYGYLSGTSMAAPVVSGAAALLQSMAVNARNAPLAAEKVRQLLMDTVDAMSWGPTAVSSGGRLNIARAVAALKTELGGYVEPPTPIALPPNYLLPQSPRPNQLPDLISPNKSNNTAQIVLPECGTSLLRNQPANQSSTLSSTASNVTYDASNAVNGDCRNEVEKYPTACAVTDPLQSNPWWTAPISQAGAVAAISIMTRADCCWNAINGAYVLVGNTTWTGSRSLSEFTECGRIPMTGVARGQRITVECEKPIQGNQIAVYLPKLKTSLIICEIDVALTAENAPIQAPEPSPYRRSLKASKERGKANRRKLQFISSNSY